MTEIQRPAPLTLVNQPRATVWQQNAAEFATTAGTSIAQHRHDGVQRAIGYLEKGMPGRAHYELVRSVLRQARIAGLGAVPITLPCPCGGRCAQ